MQIVGRFGPKLELNVALKKAYGHIIKDSNVGLAYQSEMRYIMKYELVTNL